MSGEIPSRDVIRSQARRAVDAGIPVMDCPYEQGSGPAKRWVAHYLMREIELDQQEEARIVSVLNQGPVETLEVVTS